MLSGEVDVKSPLARIIDLNRKGFGVPAHERIVLANGMTLLIVPRRDVPLVAFQMLIRGGALGDPADRAGLASLTAGLLDKGAGARDAAAFAASVEGAGGSFGASAGAECISIAGQFLAQDQSRMLELLADAVRDPRFAAPEFARQRTRQIGHLRSLKDSDPSELLPQYGRALLFGTHPYGRPASGSEESLQRIALKDVVEYHRAHIGADRAALVVAGDVDVAWLKADVARRFGAWQPAATPLPALAATVKLRKRRVLLVDSPGSAQSYFWVGATGLDRAYPRRAALDLVNSLFGGRFTSLLNSELRIRSGLSYGAASGFTRGRAAAEFAIRTFTETRHTVRALNLVLKTLSRLKRAGVSQAMLDSARSYVMGQYPMNLETAADWAAQLAELELYGQDPGYIENYAPALRNVTLDDAQQVLDEAFPLGRQLAMVVIGDAQQVRERLERYGPVQQVALAAGSFTDGTGAP
ncbi:MAG TPA: pitrilysin family protein [Steroidobacteraceae bacterium]|jgi:predicted Zn-dependent peptidase|nr:pitrilysin family protein [Steroidobacteraceae bacterium]